MDRTELVQIGVQLRERRESAGLTLSELAYQIRPLLPEREWATGEAIRAYEAATVRKLNLALVTAIGRVLGFTLRELSPDLEKDATVIRDLLEAGIRCSRVLAGAA